MYIVEADPVKPDPEGSSTLPEGASLSFFRICILPS